MMAGRMNRTIAIRVEFTVVPNGGVTDVKELSPTRQLQAEDIAHLGSGGESLRARPISAFLVRASCAMLHHRAFASAATKNAAQVNRTVLFVRNDVTTRQTGSTRTAQPDPGCRGG